MAYFDVSFDYPHTCACKSGEGWSILYHVDEKKANQQLIKAEKIVEAALKKTKLNFKHAYCYPDGSLYKYVKTDLTEERLRQVLTNALQGTKVGVGFIYKECPLSDPFKVKKVGGQFVKCRTLWEYFA
jgi:hypothetical protein